MTLDGIAIEGRLTGAVNAFGQRIRKEIGAANFREVSGRIIEIAGPIARAEISPVRIGELVEIIEPGQGRVGLGEVIGFDRAIALIAPFGSVQGLSKISEVIPLRTVPTVKVSSDLLGTVIDAQGQIQQRVADPALHDLPPALQRCRAPAPNPMARAPVSAPFVTGVKVIDALMTCGVGQRVCIIGNAGAGKSTLVAQIVSAAAVDVVVLGLVGERGREVSDMCHKLARENAMGRTVVVAATSDRPAIERLNSAFTATAIAEYFSNQGLNTLLIIDSMTRFARAGREIGLSRGEPPVRRGFPPSVFDELPRLIERAGRFGPGAITAFYTILAEGEAEFDPLVDEIKALVDGHIILSSQLAAEGRFPAIDVLQSRSRVMDKVTDDRQIRQAHHIREMISRYRDIELLLRVGEYKAGQDSLTDAAIRLHGPIDAFVQQDVARKFSFSDSLKQLELLQ